jgi:hypothetical protein
MDAWADFWNPRFGPGDGGTDVQAEKLGEDW